MREDASVAHSSATQNVELFFILFNCINIYFVWSPRHDMVKKNLIVATI